jgi:hypothetical protein
VAAVRFATYSAVVFVFRHHLFVWSVFAPKLLYEVLAVAVHGAIVGVLLLASAVAGVV